MKENDSKDLDARFKRDVAAHAGGENIHLCYACGTCTAACPVAEVDPEFNPRKIIRQVLLGMRREVLSSPEIWRCVQCYACTAKCPQNVRFREIMRALREMAVAEGLAGASLPRDVEELGRVTQKMRRDLVNALVAEPGRFAELKKQVESVAGQGN